MSKARRTGSKFSKKQLAAIDLLATGEHTIQEVADEISVSTRTIYKWRKNPLFMDAIIQSARMNLNDRLPAVYNQLTNKAVQGEFNYIKLLLEHLDKLEESKNKNADSTITFTWKTNE